MNYQIGDKVIHLIHGSGTIIAIDAKNLAGQTRQYYVVDTGQLKVWVPVDAAGENSIRPPAESFEFKALLNLLRSPAERLPDRHAERKNQLVERMQKRKLIDICGVIRDLTTRSKRQELTYNDRSVLRRAEEYLLDEWELSLGGTRSSAHRELDSLLRQDQTTLMVPSE
jgi:CarD family transcriptional regulator